MANPPANITVSWVGHGPDPTYNGFSERNGKVVHFVGLRPDLVLAGTVEELQNLFGNAGLALAWGQQEMLVEMAAEGRRRQAEVHHVQQRDLA